MKLVKMVIKARYCVQNIFWFGLGLCKKENVFKEKLCLLWLGLGCVNVLFLINNVYREMFCLNKITE